MTYAPDEEQDHRTSRRHTLGGIMFLAAIGAVLAVIVWRFVPLHAVPSWAYLAVFVLLALIYWNSARSRVPLYLTNWRTDAVLSSLLPERPGAKFIDLGHGLGGTVLSLARVRPDAVVIGVESAPLPYLISWLRARLGAPANAQLIYGDIWKHSLTGYDVVYAFLSPAPMSALYAKAQAEMTPGSVLVSNSFRIVEREADQVRSVEDGRRTQLYIYRM